MTMRAAAGSDKVTLVALIFKARPMSVVCGLRSLQHRAIRLTLPLAIIDLVEVVRPQF